MAEKKKSSSGRASSAGKAKSGNSKNSPVSRFSWKSEVFLFVVLIFCVIVFIANFGKAGVVGAALGGFFFGLFGVMSYIFPPALFLLAAFLVSNLTIGRNSKYYYPGRTLIKSLAGIVCFVFVCVIFHAVHFGRASMDLHDLYTSCSTFKSGGGLIGGLIASAMIRGIGIAATYIVAILILILCAVLISERSLFRGVSERIYDSRDEARKRSETEKPRSASERKGTHYDEMEPEPYEEGRIRRRDRRVTGVMSDTQLKSQNPPGIDPANDSSRMSEVDMSQIQYNDGFEEDFPEYEDTDNQTVSPKIYVSGQDDEEMDFVEEEIPVRTAAAKKKSTKTSKQSMQEVTQEVEGISRTIVRESEENHGDYKFPNIRLLKKGDPKKSGDSKQHLQQMSARLQETLETFGVNARVTNVVCGPSVTQYEIQPEMGVKVSKIVSLADDIKLNLMVSDIRIEAPIPGKAAIGIEVPNRENVTVALRDLIESNEFQSERSGLAFCVGKDIAGHVIVADIAKMPHLLIAGATGSGKSVCINTIIMSILFKSSPDDVKLIMIDPKVVELSVYNNIPHLLIPVVTDPKKAAGALHWAVAEMTERYERFAEYGVRDIEGYNKKIESIQDIEDEDKPQKMPRIVIIVDELADLMMVAAGDVEDAICRLAQLARAAGLHLIIATQRPSVNVVTGLIKANMPSRIAFSVTSGVDSRTILDMNGAEKLLGKGDMLFNPQEYSKPLRVQGAFVSDSEVAKVVDDIISKNGQGDYNPDVEYEVASSESSLGTSGGFPSTDDDRDVYFADAARFLIEKEKGSIGMLQRNFKIGFNRAARIMDQLEEAGVVGPEEGTKPRRVLMTMEEFDNLPDN